MAQSKAKNIAARARGGKDKPKGRSSGLGLKGKTKPERRQEATGMVPENIQGVVKNPLRWVRKNLRGIQPVRRLAAIQQTDAMLGAKEDKERWKNYLAQQVDENGRPVMDYHEDVEPTMTQMGGYIRERLGTGFTPEERAAYYGAMHDPLKAQEQVNYGNEMTRLAAAGMDPRSGIAASRAAGIQAQTGRGLAEAGRETEKANLARKAQIEGYAQDMSALEERKRDAMQTGDLNRLAQIDQQMAGLAGLGEKEREYNYDLAESQRQNEQRRRDIEKAADRMEPSTMEKVAGGISGFLGGVTGGK